MDREELKKQFGYAFAKYDNIVYYMSIDDRPRAVYMHVIRDLKDKLKELISLVPKNDNYFSDDYHLAVKIYFGIPDKIKTEECRGVIEQIEHIINKQ